MIRFEHYTIDSNVRDTTFYNHKIGVLKRYIGHEETGDFFDLMDAIEADWEGSDEPYSVVLDRLWEQAK